MAIVGCLILSIKSITVYPFVQAVLAVNGCTKTYSEQSDIK